MDVTLELDIGINTNNECHDKIKEKENFKNNFINTKNENLIINNSFSDLSLSDIGNKDKYSRPLSQRTNNKITENEEINNNNIINEIDKRSSLGSIKMEDFNNIFFIKKKKLKISKEDLNNIPIPIFSCIYCSNEKISFNHFINEQLSKKYELLASIYDIKELNKILQNKYLIDNDDKNDKLENIIICNTEYIKKYYEFNSDEYKKILFKLSGDEKKLFEMYSRKFIEFISAKLNDIKLKKNKKNKMIKIPSLTKKVNNYYSFNNLNINNNSYINNSIDGILNFNNNKKNLQNNNINQTMSNLSASNFNSVSLINYIDNNFLKEKDNKFKLDDIIEQIEKNSNIESIRFNMSRNIKKEDIEWEEECYNIWEPNIEPIFTHYIPITNKKLFNNINKTFIKIQNKSKTFYKILKENNNSHKKLNTVQSKGKEKEKENLMVNKSYQKNNNNISKNKTKDKSKDRNKIYKIHTITHLITHSSKNNKRNILLKLNNKTPKLKDVKNKNKINTFTKKDNSQKYLIKLSTNISLNIKKNLNMNPINLFNSSNKVVKLRNYQLMKNQIPLNITIVNKSTNKKKKTKNKINLCENNCKAKNESKKEKINKNKINERKIISQNSSVSSKNLIPKKEIINSLPKHHKINIAKRNQIDLTNKISRNNTYQNLQIIKEKSVIINIKNNGYCETKVGLSNKKHKCKSKKIIDSKNKLNINLNKKEINNNNNIQIKNKNGNNITKINNYNYNYNDSKKMIYDIKILDKKNVEIKKKNFDKKKLY